MVVEQFIPERHYEKVCSWWEGHGWPRMPLHALPSRGYIVEDIAAGFLYSTDSAIAWMEFIVANPAAKDRDIYSGVRDLVNEIIKDATEDGYSMIFTAVRHRGLGKLYERQDFKITDSGMNLMMWTKGVE